MEAKQLALAYEGHLTATNDPRPLSREWGEDLEALEVDVFNPDESPTAAPGTANAVTILVGAETSQRRVIAPGGNTGRLPVTRLSDVHVKTRGAGTSVRITFQVFKENTDDV